MQKTTLKYLPFYPAPNNLTYFWNFSHFSNKKFKGVLENYSFGSLLSLSFSWIFKSLLFPKFMVFYSFIWIIFKILLPFLLLTILIFSFFIKNTIFFAFSDLLFFLIPKVSLLFLGILFLFLFLLNDNNQNAIFKLSFLPLGIEFPFQTINLFPTFPTQPGGLLLSVSLFCFCSGITVASLYHQFYPPFSKTTFTPLNSPEGSSPIIESNTHLIIPTPNTQNQDLSLVFDVENLKNLSLETYNFLFSFVKPFFKLTNILISRSSMHLDKKAPFMAEIKKNQVTCDKLIDKIQETLTNLNTELVLKENLKEMLYNPNVVSQISEAIIVTESSQNSISLTPTPMIESSTTFAQHVNYFLLLLISG